MCDALGRVQIEIEACASERQVQFGENDVAAAAARDRGSHVVGDGRRADAAFRSDKGEGAPKFVGAVLIETRNGADDQHRIDRRHEVFADPACEQVAVNGDVVGVADDDHFGAGLADVGELIELGIELGDGRELSMTTRFGGAARRYSSIAAAMPPGDTVAWARDMRRSATALSMVSIMPGVSQKACSVMCGTRTTSMICASARFRGASAEIWWARFVIAPRPLARLFALPAGAPALASVPMVCRSQARLLRLGLGT